MSAHLEIADKLTELRILTDLMYLAAGGLQGTKECDAMQSLAERLGDTLNENHAPSQRSRHFGAPQNRKSIAPWRRAGIACLSCSCRVDRPNCTSPKLCWPNGGPGVVHPAPGLFLDRLSLARRFSSPAIHGL